LNIPDDLHTALNNQIANANTKQLLDAAQDISLRYRQRDNNNKQDKHFIQNDIESLAYAVARMPATYGAIYNALKYALEIIENQAIDIKSLTDIGAGTGAATWAANELIDLDSITCVEYDASMRNLGKALMSQTSEPLKNAKWENFNIANIINTPFIYQADLIIASYVINELDENLQLKIAEELWSATKKVLLFVETGTPNGYNLLNKIRTKLLSHNAHILAPCFHENICPVSKIESDWCHFTCRVQRSRLHKQAKGGELAYEDEKYSYLALSKKNISHINSINYGRILRHPQIGKGHVKLNLCTKDGLKQATYSKRNGDIYKSARKANCGDKINL